MKIALISRYCNKRQGIPSVVANLAECFSEKHEVHIFSQTCEDVDTKKIFFHSLPALFPRHFINELFFFIIAGLLLRKYRFDVVHFHDPCLYQGGIFTSHAFPRAGIKRIRRLNKICDTGITDKYFHTYKLLFPVSEYNMSLKSRTRIIAVSNRMKTNIVTLLGRQPDDIDVVPNGVNPEKFDFRTSRTYRKEIREKHFITENDFIILFVGYYHLRKGLKFLIEALKQINNELIKILVVGDDPFRREYLLSLINEYRLERRIIFAGDQKEMGGFYASGDVLVLPTLYEPFGNVVLEAMCCSVPVILSRQAGACDIIQDGENGLLINDPTNPLEIAKLIQKLYDNPGMMKTIAERGYATAIRYSWNTIAKRTLDIYKSYIDDRGNRIHSS
ncbi:MAG: glycosyltransferase family 4 protein [Spirochaetales bacterium]|nr:glycosyltransferase family 4 protein [Spirochaetales bacterium]